MEVDEIKHTTIKLILSVGTVLGIIVLFIDIYFKILFGDLNSFILFKLEITLMFIYGVCCWVILIWMWKNNKEKHKTLEVKNGKI